MAFLLRKRTILIILFASIFIISVYMMFLGNFPRVVYEKNPTAPDTQKVLSQQQSSQETAPGTALDKKENNSDFFIDYKLERDRLRSQEADYLRELINNPNATRESRDQAQKDLIALSQRVEKEMIVENLIKAKGFEDAVIFISNDFANVVIKGASLQSKQVAQITDIVTKTTGIPIEKITIIERK
ncbi:MAG: stage sporulation protein [Thermoanaerobacteraceae bacterium]|nr:stage sporulation protein [Thermoanaerobacteraceae bacterium]MDN5303113.1 stage sporulation protein [Thermoanaerobacteraceae bacterium]